MEDETATLTSVVHTMAAFSRTNPSHGPLDRNRDIHITGATGGDDSLLECDIARESGQADSGRKEALIDGGGGEGDARFHCLPLWAGRLPFAGDACC